MQPRFRASVVVACLVATGVLIGSDSPILAQPTTTVPPSTESPVGTTTTVPACPDPEAVAVVAVFTGEPSQGDDDTLVFDEIDLESGQVNTPVVVSYPGGLPVLDDVAAIRVRVVETDTGFESEVECGGTTGTDDEILPVDDDRLAAIARTAGDLSQRAGRWALTASLVVFVAVVALTLFRRWRPRLW